MDSNQLDLKNMQVKFALFVSFFPQLVAGPIERAGHLLPQFEKLTKIDYKRITDGLKLIIWGFIQKIVIADTLSILVNEVYNKPGSYHGLDIWTATFFFAFQIYCDFSGYTDIARGTAKILGYDLRINFNLPYFAKSFAGFGIAGIFLYAPGFAIMCISLSGEAKQNQICGLLLI